MINLSLFLLIKRLIGSLYGTKFSNKEEVWCMYGGCDLVVRLIYG